MPTQRFDVLGGAWSASSRITADVDTAVSIVNNTDQTVFWALTTNENPPALEVFEGEPIAVMDRDRPALKAGERLWLAARRSDCQITLTTGAA